MEQHENKIEEVTKEAIPSITRDDWKKQINHIKKVEEEYWNRDVGRESEIEVFIISVGMNSDSEDESDDYDHQDCESKILIGFIIENDSNNKQRKTIPNNL